MGKYGWTDASTGNPAHLLSPAWTFNKVNGGVNSLGTMMDSNGQVIVDWGVPSLAAMPYDQNDLTSWGSEAAFREAPWHRAAQVSYVNYDPTEPDTAINSIKNLISSDTPVTFAIASGQFVGHLEAYYHDNILSAMEYNSTKYNHAQTIVGYDDSMMDPAYPDVGAFKVVNSWGKGFANNGTYWISYDTIKKIGNNGNLFLTYITDRPHYQPTLLATWQFSSAPTRDWSITIGLGAPGGTSNETTPYFGKNVDPVNASFPKFMALDITPLLSYYQNGTATLYLTIGTTRTTGTVMSFQVERYQDGFGNLATDILAQSHDVPKTLPGPATVSVAMVPYIGGTANNGADPGGSVATNGDMAFIIAGIGCAAAASPSGFVIWKRKRAGDPPEREDDDR